jgi:hypothetical protein
VERCQLLRWCLLTPNHIIFPNIILTFHPHLQQISWHYVNGASVGRQCSHTSFPKFHTFLTIFHQHGRNIGIALFFLSLSLHNSSSYKCHFLSGFVLGSSFLHRCACKIQLPTNFLIFLDSHCPLLFINVPSETTSNMLIESLLFWFVLSFIQLQCVIWCVLCWVFFVIFLSQFFFYVFLCCIHLVMLSVANGFFSCHTSISKL